MEQDHPEYISPRGIGSDNTPGCFVCGGEQGEHANFAGFVRSKEAGERVVALFERGARLDYRPSEPDRIQVKIGACKKHISNLKFLQFICNTHRIIDKSIVEIGREEE